MGALLLGGALALGSVGLAPGVHRHVGPGEIKLTMSVGEGRTVLSLPPLGVVSAQTHTAPVSVEAQVEQVRMESLPAELAGGRHSQEQLIASGRQELGEGLIQLSAQVLGLGVGVGVAGVALVLGRRRRTLLLGGVGAALAVGGSLGAAWVSFDETAFEDARYEGSIAHVPALLATFNARSRASGEVESRLSALSHQLNDAYAATSASPGGPAGGSAILNGDEAEQVSILHVSDIHSNPLGAALVTHLATSFNVDAVLDTGDITSFGQVMETELVEGVGSARRPGSPEAIPYLVAPGNHDGFAARAALGRIPGVRVFPELNQAGCGKLGSTQGGDAGAVWEIGEGAQRVRILGVADPTFTADNQLDTEEIKATKTAAAQRYRALLLKCGVELGASHDPFLVEPSAGAAPVLVAGHRHRRQLSYQDGSVLLEVGSAGGGGIAAEPSAGGGVYEAQLLRFSEGKLVAVDYLKLSGTHGEFQLERTAIDPEELEKSAAEQDSDASLDADGVPATETGLGVRDDLPGPLPRGAVRHDRG